MPVFCKNEPNNPSLIVYTYYIVLYYLYISIQTLQISTGLVAQSVEHLPLNWLVREVPGSIPARGLYPKMCDFFYISKGSGYACSKLDLS